MKVKNILVVLVCIFVAYFQTQAQNKTLDIKTNSSSMINDSLIENANNAKYTIDDFKIIKQKGTSYIVKQLNIEFKGYKALGLHIKECKLDRGSKLYIRNADSTEFRGPYTASNILNDFLIMPLKGDKLIVELYEDTENSNSRIEIDELITSSESMDEIKSKIIIIEDNYNYKGINGDDGANWQKEKYAITALIYHDIAQNKFTYLSTAFFIRTYLDSTKYFFLTSRSALENKLGNDIISISLKSANIYLVFLFESSNESVYTSTPENLYNYYPTYRNPALILAGNQHDAEKCYNYALYNVRREDIPTDVSIYNLGWDIREIDVFNMREPYTIISHAYNTELVTDVKSKHIESFNYVSSNNQLLEFYSPNGSPANAYNAWKGTALMDVNHRAMALFQNYTGDDIFNAVCFPYIWDMQTDWDIGAKSTLRDFMEECSPNPYAEYIDGRYCLDKLTVYYSNPIYVSTEIKADENIYISSKIYSGNTVAKAKTSITLQPNFEVVYGATFEVSFDPCN